MTALITFVRSSFGRLCGACAPAALAAALVLGSVPAAHAGVEISHAFYYFNEAGQRVDVDGNRVVMATGASGLQSVIPQAQVQSSGPLSTALTWNGAASGELGVRSIKASLSMDARESPWDQRNPPPRDARVGNGVVSIDLVDTIRLSSLSGLFGAQLVSARLRSSAFSGELRKTGYTGDGAGSAAAEVRVDYSLVRVGTGGTISPVFSRFFNKALELDANPETWSPGLTDPIGTPSFLLAANVDHIVAISLRVAGTLSGDPFPAESPGLRSIVADFGSTLRLGGFGEFRDENGNLLTDVRMESALGIDWLAPLDGGPAVIPIPGSLALFAGALPLLMLLGWRRRALGAR